MSYHNTNEVTHRQDSKKLQFLDKFYNLLLDFVTTTNNGFVMQWPYCTSVFKWQLITNLSFFEQIDRNCQRQIRMFKSSHNSVIIKFSKLIVLCVFDNDT